MTKKTTETPKAHTAPAGAPTTTAAPNGVAPAPTAKEYIQSRAREIARCLLACPSDSDVGTVEDVLWDVVRDVAPAPTAAPTSHPPRPRRPRRARYVLVVGGTPLFGGYVELGEAHACGAAVVELGLMTREEALAEGQVVVRETRGVKCVALYARPRRGSTRTPAPVWSFDPRGLPEAWR